MNSLFNGKTYDGHYLLNTLLFDWDQISNIEQRTFVQEFRGYELDHFEDSCLKNESFGDFSTLLHFLLNTISYKLI